MWLTVWRELTQTSEATLYDAVQLFAVALTELSRARDVRTSSLSCAKPRPWKHGSSLSNYVRTVFNNHQHPQHRNISLRLQEALLSQRTRAMLRVCQ